MALVALAFAGVLLLWLRHVPVFESLAPTWIDRPAPERAADARPPRVVVLISVDGLASWLLESTETPVLERLANEGTWAQDARTVVPPFTLPSHASMLSGVAPEVHGVGWNRHQPWSAFDQETLFTVCGRRALRCGLFAGKRKLVLFAAGEEGVERYAFGESAASVLHQALGYLDGRDADFALVHLAEVDLVGHEYGWGSPAQRTSLREIDAAIGIFLSLLEGRVDRPLAVLVTADHGGLGNQHHLSRPEILEIPWIAWGDGVRAGADPGPVSTLDTAPTLLALLGVPAPAGWAGRVHHAILNGEAPKAQP